ncbi:FIG1 Factor-induced gene 1 protein [Candida maltosa Xu316]|uniref:Factor-induced gene 1 protein n=1 Tax=Candida maltosa (strain Xu316) TaxID=1245528 RepID=M3JTM8_CANMX|nr:hypothetical protein G210_4089 [Candida maltosa Xu316]
MPLISKFSIFITVIIQFIATVLLSFLLLGCIDTSSNFSNVYLIDYKFNSTSLLYNHLSSSSNSSIHSTTLDDLSVRIGYMGVCLHHGEDLACTSYSALETFQDYSISMLSANLDLVQLAESFSSICHPRMLLSTIVLTLVSLVFLCYCIIPIVPGKFLVKKINAVVTFLNIMLWGLGSMLERQAVATSMVMMEESSFQLLSVSKGGRAEAITWTAFSFLLVVFLSMCFACWTEFKYRKATQPSTSNQTEKV